MGFEKDQKVVLKQWDNILPTLDLINGKFTHKTSGLIISPRSYMGNYHKEMIIDHIDTYGDVWTICKNVFHQDWLDIV